MHTILCTTTSTSITTITTMAPPPPPLETVLGASVPASVGVVVLLRAAFSAEQWRLVRQFLSEFRCAVVAFDKGMDRQPVRRGL